LIDTKHDTKLVREYKLVSTKIADKLVSTYKLCIMPLNVHEFDKLMV